MFGSLFNIETLLSRGYFYSIIEKCINNNGHASVMNCILLWKYPSVNVISKWIITEKLQWLTAYITTEIATNQSNIYIVNAATWAISICHGAISIFPIHQLTEIAPRRWSQNMFYRSCIFHSIFLIWCCFVLYGFIFVLFIYTFFFISF